MDYTIGMPTKAPDDMMIWLIKSGQLASNTILYKMGYYTDTLGKRHRAVKCTCSECGKSFFADYAMNLAGGVYGWFDVKEKKSVYNKDLTFCPLCGAEAEHAAAEAEQLRDEMKKREIAANKSVIEFETLFRTAQENMNKLIDITNNADPDIAIKLKSALKAYLERYLNM